MSSSHHSSIPPIEENTNNNDNTTNMNNSSNNNNDDDDNNTVRTMDPEHTITSHTFGGLCNKEYVEVVPARIQSGAPLATVKTSLHSVQSAPETTAMMTKAQDSPLALKIVRPHSHHHRMEPARQLSSLFRTSESSDDSGSRHDTKIRSSIHGAPPPPPPRTDHHSKASADTDDCRSFASCSTSNDNNDDDDSLSRNTTDDPIHLRLARRVPFADGLDETVKLSRRRSGTAILVLGILVLVLAVAGTVVVATRAARNKNKRSAARNKNFLVTATELEQHNSPDDCWLLIHGRVLDVSKFDHPGGREMLTPFCGQDATTPYRMQHPDTLLATIGEPMVVGVAIASLPTNPPVAPPTAAPTATMAFPNNITIEELAMHNDPDADCWIVVDGHVYNYTNFSVTAKEKNTTISFCGTNAPFALIDEEMYKRMGTLIVAPPPTTSSPIEKMNTGAPAVTPNTSAPSTNVPSSSPTKNPTPAPSTASPTTTAPTNVPSTSGPTARPTTSPTKSPEVVIGRSELSLHDDPDDDCWVAIHGTVYDLTKYAPYHPGGAGNITAHCGADGSPAFAKVHTVANLNYARAYTVGSYEPEQTIPPTAAPTTSQTILLSEMAAHNTSNDCFMALHGTVYDLTAFAPGHPGGSGTIYNHCGMDGTESFGMHHNVTTLDVMAKPYVLGRLVID